MDARIDKDTYYLRIAEAVAARSTCLKKKYGAVIVNNSEIIATGYNGAPRGEESCLERGECYCCTHQSPIDPSASTHGSQYGVCVAVHAEMNAIISASRQEMIGATLYLVCLNDARIPAPCNVCNRLIKNAGIKKIVTYGGGKKDV